MKAVYEVGQDDDFDGKELGELELKFKEYKEGLTVKELKELLANEADDNIIGIMTKDGTQNVTLLLAPVMKSSSGEETINDTGVSIRFVVNNKE